MERTDSGFCLCVRIIGEDKSPAMKQAIRTRRIMDMAEGIRELKQEEMAKVSGGGINIDEVITPNQPSDPGGVKTTTSPYCKACKCQVQLVGGLYVCDHVGCSEIAVPKTAKEVDWH